MTRAPAFGRPRGRTAPAGSKWWCCAATTRTPCAPWLGAPTRASGSTGWSSRWAWRTPPSSCGNPRLRRMIAAASRPRLRLRRAPRQVFATLSGHTDAVRWALRPWERRSERRQVFGLVIGWYSLGQWQWGASRIRVDFECKAPMRRPAFGTARDGKKWRSSSPGLRFSLCFKLFKAFLSLSCPQGGQSSWHQSGGLVSRWQQARHGWCRGPRPSSCSPFRRPMPFCEWRT